MFNGLQAWQALTSLEINDAKRQLITLHTGHSKKEIDNCTLTQCMLIMTAITLSATGVYILLLTLYSLILLSQLRIKATLFHFHVSVHRYPTATPINSHVISSGLLILKVNFRVTKQKPSNQDLPLLSRT